MKNNINNYKYLYITLLIAILPRVLLCLFVDTFVYYPSDEVATIAGGAFLAGYNWNQVVSTAGYYGQGFYSLFAPLYIITDNPFIIFKITIIVCSIIQGSTAYIAFICLSKYLKLNNPAVICSIAVASSYLLDTRSTNLLNETPLMLMCWIFLLLLFKLNEAAPKSKTKHVYTILLIAALGYSITLHTRAILLGIALLITIIIYYHTYRKWLVSPSIFLGFGAICLVVSSIGIAVLQSRLWGSADGEIRNTSIDINFDMITALLKPYNWQGVANIVLGLLNTAIILSFGTMVIFLTIFTKIIWDSILRKPYITKNSHSSISYYLTGAVFFLSCTIIMILGLAVKWLPGAAQGIQDGLGSNNYGFRAFVYYRYFAVFLSPLLMLLLSYIHQNEIRLHFKAATITLVLTQAYWMVCIVPYLCTFNDFEVKKFFSFSLFLIDKVNIWVFFFASLVLFISWFILWYLYTHQKKLLATTTLAALLLINYCIFVIYNDYEKQDKNYHLVNAGYEYIHNNQDIIDTQNIIYVPMNNKLPYLYQYFLMRYTVIPSYPSPNTDHAIVLWNIPDDSTLLSMGYVYAKLDENEYLYTNDDGLILKLINSGLVFSNR
ncbi:MAG: hypothetical protein H2184_04675 [Candidatus Galacturonibacter soehngenii]|nr:hypothetical protein [Candidatus Galacturonibacter soehngenii]